MIGAVHDPKSHGDPLPWKHKVELLTDGKPNDLDVYEGRYGLEDTRHAVHRLGCASPHESRGRRQSAIHDAAARRRGRGRGGQEVHDGIALFGGREVERIRESLFRRKLVVHDLLVMRMS